jgi:DNA-binding NarL/FixJ family response regulator
MTVSPPDKPRDTVLVIDDSPESLSLLTDTLEENGFTALVARSGRAALGLIERVQPDVILMDAVMPEMDGFETCREIKRDRRFEHIPIIFMTGLSETEHVVLGFSAGGVDYVTKPVAPHELIARITRHIANSRLAQSARIALDMSGSTLMAVDEAGHLLWTTPKARETLQALIGVEDSPRETFHRELGAIVRERASRSSLETAGTLRVSFLGEARPGEFLLGLSSSEAPDDEEVLRRTFDLTEREAEVTLWVAQGKPNRDIAEILNCSPRTVNKHLEQIYTKLGVENRTAAALVVVRVLVHR